MENLRVFAEQTVVRVSTPDGYLWLPIVVPECFREAFRRPHAISEIVRKRDGWYLMLAIKHEDVPMPQGERPHFGLDLGLANLAVLSGPGIARFFDGKPLRYVRGKFFRYRQALQKKRKIGAVKRSRGRESRWTANENHRISREVIDAVATAGGVLHVERLTGIRERCKGTKKINRMIAVCPSRNCWPSSSTRLAWRAFPWSKKTRDTPASVARGAATQTATIAPSKPSFAASNAATRYTRTSTPRGISLPEAHAPLACPV